MALLAMNGFDDYGDAADTQSDPNIILFSPAGVTTGRTGQQALLLNSFQDECEFILPQNTSNTYYFGFAFKFNAHGSSSAILVETSTTGGTLQNRVYMTTGGIIFVTRSTTTIATGTLPVNDSGIWNHLVVKIFLNDTTGTVETWLNGVKDIDATGLDTLNSAGNTISRVRFDSWSSANPHALDDVYIGDDSGSDMTDQQGDCVVERLDPNANGTTNNFTASPAVANYLNVDDGDTPDDDTTYNHSATATNKELYALTDIVGAVDTMHAVQVRARIRKEDAGSRTVDLICRNNVTEVNSAAKGLSTDYTYISEIYENDPDGGGNWTEADVNSMEVGIELN